MNWLDSEKLALPLSLLVIILITLILYILLKNKSKRVKKIPLIVLSSLLLVMEVIKQLISLINNSWSYWNLPLHFCSLFMVFFALAAFGKGKVERIGYTLSFVSCLWFFILFYFNPSSIIGTSSAHIFGSFADFHTFVYHHVIILFFAIMVSLKLYRPVFKDIKFLLIGYSIYFIVGVGSSNILNINYCNLLYSNIGFMQSLLELAGYIIYIATMYASGVSVGCLFIIAGSAICNIYEKNKVKVDDEIAENNIKSNMR